MRQITRHFIQLCLFLLGVASMASAQLPLPLRMGPYEPPLPLPIPLKLDLPTKKLTLYDAIMLALRNNPNVQSGEIQRISDKFALEVAHNAFEPQYSLTASATFSEGSTPSYLVTPGVTLTTPIGTQLSTTYSNSFIGSTGHTTTIQAVQPLLRGFGPGVTLAPLREAYYQEYGARLNLKNTVMTTVTQVIQNYFQLVQAYNNLTVDQLALEESKKLLVQYQIQIKAGRIAPAELVQQQSQVASQELSVTQAQNAISQAYQELMLTIGIDPNSKLQIDQNITIPTLITPSIEQSTQLALDNNVQYQQAIFSLKSAQVNLLEQQDQQKWQLNLTATKTFANNGGSTSIVTPGGATVTTTGVGSVALNLSVPLNDMPRQQGLVNAQVQLVQQKIALAETKRELRIQVINAIQNLKFQQEQIIQAQQAVDYAQRSLDVEKIKLRFGRSTVFTVTQLQNTLINSKLSLISQQITYINTLATFEQLIGVTLDKYGLKICY